MKPQRNWPKNHHPRQSLALRIVAATALWLFTGMAMAQSAKGTMTVNGTTSKVRYATAYEIDSDTEPGFLDVLVVISDRKLSEQQVKSQEALEALMMEAGLVALAVTLDPDCKVKRVATYHPAFEHFLVNGGSTDWEPSAFDEKVAGRFSTPGRQEAVSQRWTFDLTFSAPIHLDPEATTVGSPQD